MFQGIILKEESEQGFKVIALCRTSEDSDDYYAFFAVDPCKYFRFVRNIREGVDPATCGAEILYKGKGKSPSLSILHEVRQKFDIRQEITDPVVRRAISSINADNGDEKVSCGHIS